jgi:hypothetical protein
LEHKSAVRAVIQRYERDPMAIDEVLADVFLLANTRAAELAGGTAIHVRRWRCGQRAISLPMRCADQ